MPQLDPTYFASQIFWLAVTFGLLYLTMARVIVPRITEVLENRQTKVASDLERAEKFHAEAESARRDYEHALADAKAQALKVISEAHMEMERKQQQLQVEMDGKIRAKVREAETKLAVVREDLVKQFRVLSIEVSGAMVQKLLGDHVGEDELEEAVGRVVIRG